MQQGEQAGAQHADYEYNPDGNDYHHVGWFAYYDAGGILRLDKEVMEAGSSSVRYNYDDGQNVSVTAEMNGTSSSATWHITYRDIGGVELFKGYPTVLLHFASVCCMLFVVVGVPGNLITIIALNTCKKVIGISLLLYISGLLEVRNATAVFIMNLAFSDLLSGLCTLPLAASTFWNRHWLHGELLCRLFPLLRYGLMAVSLFSVLAITINRYVMIGHPTFYPKLYRKWYLGLMVGCTWTCGFGALVATWFGRWGRFGLDIQVGSCSILPDEDGRTPKEFLFLVAFVIPCVSIVGCYARIFYIVRRTALKSRTQTSSASFHVPETRKNRRGGSNGSGDTGVLTIPSSGNGRRHLRRPNISSTDDSAIGSSTGPSSSTISTERSSHLSVPLFNPTPTITEQLSPGSIPPSPTPSLAPTSLLNGGPRLGRPTSSSGLDAERFDASSTGSASPITPQSSMLDLPRSRSRSRSGTRGAAVNAALSHVAAVLRRSSNLRPSPRRHSSTVQVPVPQPGKMTAKDRKLLKMILVIFASFVVCYLPITLSKTFRDLFDHSSLNIAGYVLIYLTTCINPIIYVVMSSEYRQAYKNLLMCKSGEVGGPPTTGPTCERGSSRRRSRRA